MAERAESVSLDELRFDALVALPEAQERFQRAEAEVERLRSSLDANVAVQLGLSDALNERDAEIERLREENSRLHIAFTGQKDSLKRLREERQAVLDCINLYGDETLHSAYIEAGPHGA